MTNLVPIPFHSTEILAAVIDGVPHVAIRQACDSIGLDADSQLKRLKRQPWASTVIMTVQVPGDSQGREIALVDRQTFTMWLATVDASRVKNDEAREMLVAFQREAATALDQYFHEGGVINPRATEDQRARLASIALAQMGMLAAGKELLPAAWLAAKARIVVARGLGEVPEIDAADLPMYVDTFLAEKGLKGDTVRQTRSAFGRKLAAAYRDRHGTDPEKSPAEVGGRPRQVNTYYGRDRDLFERVWAEHYADTLDIVGVDA